jgi:hypothetical protein
MIVQIELQLSKCTSLVQCDVKIWLEATMILCDNQSCINMTENPKFHDKTKHIEIRYHYIRDMVQKGVVKLQYVGTYEQVADVLTKPLSHVKFEYF